MEISCHTVILRLRSFSPSLSFRILTQLNKMSGVTRTVKYLVVLCIVENSTFFSRLLLAKAFLSIEEAVSIQSLIYQKGMV